MKLSKKIKRKTCIVVPCYIPNKRFDYIRLAQNLEDLQDFELPASYVRNRPYICDFKTIECRGHVDDITEYFPIDNKNLQIKNDPDGVIRKIYDEKNDGKLLGGDIYLFHKTIAIIAPDGWE